MSRISGVKEQSGERIEILIEHEVMGRNVRIQADKYFVVCKQADILKNDAQVAKEKNFAR